MAVLKAKLSGEGLISHPAWLRASEETGEDSEDRTRSPGCLQMCHARTPSTVATKGEMSEAAATLT